MKVSSKNKEIRTSTTPDSIEYFHSLASIFTSKIRVIGKIKLVKVRNVSEMSLYSTNDGVVELKNAQIIFFFFSILILILISIFSSFFFIYKSHILDSLIIFKMNVNNFSSS